MPSVPCLPAARGRTSPFCLGEGAPDPGRPAQPGASQAPLPAGQWEGLWSRKGLGKGWGSPPWGGHRLGPARRARRPRARARPRLAPGDRVRAGALLCRLRLHRSSWQHRVAAAPLLTWPGRLCVGVHASTQSFSTRFPSRGSTADRWFGQPAPRLRAPQPRQPAPVAPKSQSPAPGAPGPTDTDILLAMVPRALGHLHRAPPQPALTLGPGPAVARAGRTSLGSLAVGGAGANMAAEGTGWGGKDTGGAGARAGRDTGGLGSLPGHSPLPALPPAPLRGPRWCSCTHPPGPGGDDPPWLGQWEEAPVPGVSRERVSRWLVQAGDLATGESRSSDASREQPTMAGPAPEPVPSGPHHGHEDLRLSQGQGVSALPC